MSEAPVTAIVFDAGAFIAWERNDPRVRALVALAESGALTLRTSAAVTAQVWRGGARQARLARLLGADTIAEHPLDRAASRRIGLIAAEFSATDVVDGHVAMLADGDSVRVLTSDPDDLQAWGVPAARVIAC